MQNNNDSTFKYTPQQLEQLQESISNFFALLSAETAEESLYSMLHSALASGEVTGLEAANALSTVRSISELLRTLEPPHFVISAQQIITKVA